MTNNFIELGVSERIDDLLKKSRIYEPTPIQEKAIPMLLEGKDIIAEAQTGTGKTLAFVLPMIEKINPDRNYIQGLIITPTRELAIQITSVLKLFTADLGINVLSAYGGQDVDRQISKLKGGIHIVIGTPGRLLDHINRKSIDLSRLSMLVLDEADQMLSMGFLQDVEEIMRHAPKNKRQTMMFSATITKGVKMISKKHMTNSVDIRIKTQTVTLELIDQVAIETTEKNKYNDLVVQLHKYNPFIAIIFCKTKERAQTLSFDLAREGFTTEELHGDLTQSKRERVMRSLRDAKFQLLIATDIASRGLDVEGITHIFNYDLPRDAEGYIHRIGRTGRAGEKGIAVTFYTQQEKYNLSLIESGIGVKIKKEKRTI